MPSYFRQVPDFDYVSRDPNQRQISEYATVKNLFRRGKLREDIFGNLSYFTKYQIIGDERPDNVAFKIYNDETLDWVVLLSNNILNIQTEWPLPQSVFDKVMLEKYESYDKLYSDIHHYETTEIRDSLGNLILPAGIKMSNEWKSSEGFVQSFKTSASFVFSTTTDDVSIIPSTPIPDLKNGNIINLSNFLTDSLNGSFIAKDILTTPSNSSFVTSNNLTTRFNVTPKGIMNPSDFNTSGNEVVEFISTKPIKNSTNYYYQYYDNNLETTVRIPSTSILKPVTNYEYESQLENDKRNIFLLKPNYINVFFNDIEEIMPYKEGSTQYVSRTLKKGDNIRLYS